MTLQGVLVEIHRDLTIMDIALPYFKEQIINNKFKDMDLTEIGRFLYSSVRSTLELSTKSLDLVKATLEGRLKLNLELKTWMKILAK